MDVLFIHPNFPGQFLRVSKAFAEMPGMRVFALGDDSWIKDTSGQGKITGHRYPSPEKTVHEELHAYARGFNDAVRRAERVLQVLATVQLKTFI